MILIWRMPRLRMVILSWWWELRQRSGWMRVRCRRLHSSKIWVIVRLPRWLRIFRLAWSIWAILVIWIPCCSVYHVCPSWNLLWIRLAMVVVVVVTTTTRLPRCWWTVWGIYLIKCLPLVLLDQQAVALWIKKEKPSWLHSSFWMLCACIILSLPIRSLWVELSVRWPWRRGWPPSITHSKMLRSVSAL